MVKYADDISLSIPVVAKLIQADSEIEVEPIMEWAKDSRTSLNLGKTWEMLMKGKTEKYQPDPLQDILRKSNLRLFGVIFEDSPTSLNTNFDHMLYPKLVLVFTFCVSASTTGFSVDYLDLHFKSVILPILTYAIEVWSGAFFNKYLSRIDNVILF